MGFSWFSYFKILEPFENIINNYSSEGFEWFRENINNYLQQVLYIEQIRKVALAIGMVFSQLPLPLIYLSSIGFSFTILIVILRIVIDLL